MFESKTGILFIAGVGFFVFAFVSNGALPMVMYKHLPEKSAEEVVNPRLIRQFRNLQLRWPEPFQARSDTWGSLLVSSRPVLRSLSGASCGKVGPLFYMMR